MSYNTDVTVSHTFSIMWPREDQNGYVQKTPVVLTYFLPAVCGCSIPFIIISFFSYALAYYFCSKNSVKSGNLISLFLELICDT